jgi:hypothetical protein
MKYLHYAPRERTRSWWRRHLQARRPTQRTPASTRCNHKCQLVRTFSARSRRAALPVATVIHSQGPTSGTLGSGRTQKSAVAECRKELASAFPESDRALRRREAAGGRSGRRTPPMRYTGRPVPASRATKAIAGPAGADVSVRGKAQARAVLRDRSPRACWRAVSGQIGGCGGRVGICEDAVTALGRSRGGLACWVM